VWDKRSRGAAGGRSVRPSLEVLFPNSLKTTLKIAIGVLVASGGFHGSFCVYSVSVWLFPEGLGKAIPTL
jgi:hypothetical protein